MRKVSALTGGQEEDGVCSECRGDWCVWCAGHSVSHALKWKSLFASRCRLWYFYDGALGLCAIIIYLGSELGISRRDE